MKDTGNKENAAGSQTPRRSVRIAKSLLMQELPGNEPPSASKPKTPGKVIKTPGKVTKTPAKGGANKTPARASAKKSPKRMQQKTPKTPKDTTKKTPMRMSAKSAGKSTPKLLKSVQSLLGEFSEKEVTRKNLFPDNEAKGGNLIGTFSKSMEIIAEKSEEEIVAQDKEGLIDEGMVVDENPAVEEMSDNLELPRKENSEAKEDEVTVPGAESPNLEPTTNDNEKPEDKLNDEEKAMNPVVAETVPQMEQLMESPKLEVNKTDDDEKLMDVSCVIIDDSFEGDNAKDVANDKNIIVIPDTPMPPIQEKNDHKINDETFSPEPKAEKFDRKLNETFSPEPEAVVFKNLPKLKEDEMKEDEKISPKKMFKMTPKKSPKRLSNTAGKSSSFAPLIASSALKSSILLDSKFLSPLKSIRKRSLSTNDIDCSKKINRVIFHSPSNMEISVCEIDERMRPYFDEIRQERDAYVSARAQEKKLMRRHKRSMSNVETDSAKKLLSGKKTPTKKNPDFILGKVPDFKAIHAASFKKMENLVDYKNRKEERAKSLLNASGKTSCTPSTMKSTLVIQVKAADSSSLDATIPECPPVQADVKEDVEGSSLSADNKNVTMRPVIKIEDRQQKWRAMHKSGNRKDTKSASQKGSEVLKGVRTNRRFDLLMKFRDAQN